MGDKHIRRVMAEAPPREVGKPYYGMDARAWCGELISSECYSDAERAAEDIARKFEGILTRTPP